MMSTACAAHKTVTDLCCIQNSYRPVLYTEQLQTSRQVSVKQDEACVFSSLFINLALKSFNSPPPPQEIQNEAMFWI